MGRLNLRWDLESKTNFEESLGGVSWLKTSPSSIGRSCSVQKKELSWAEQVRKNRTREISASRFIIFVHLQPRALHHWWQWSRISWEQPSCLCHLCPEMRGIPWNFGQEGNDFHQLWIQGMRRRICVLMGQPGSLISFTSVVSNNIPLFFWLCDRPGSALSTKYWGEHLVPGADRNNPTIVQGNLSQGTPFIVVPQSFGSQGCH